MKTSMDRESSSQFLHHEPCPNCGSKDNLGRYSDGHGYCFGCNYRDQDGEVTTVIAERKDARFVEGDAVALPSRGLSNITCEKFGYKVGLHTVDRMAACRDRNLGSETSHL